jgi:hypothetical protein
MFLWKGIAIGLSLFYPDLVIFMHYETPYEPSCQNG